ncbi:MAG TPA: hypothetical protein VHZ76_04285 [Gammaproteobacteria bacterium]|jgi:hypothetical protein|nr:hypothetical protein [Gammaproteobacteria bacterium]
MTQIIEIDDFEEFDTAALTSNHMLKIQKIANEICYYYCNLARLYAHASGNKKLARGSTVYIRTNQDNKNLLLTVKNIQAQITDLEKKFRALVRSW